MIVRIARAKVGHRQAPFKAKGPLRRAFGLVVVNDDDLLEERQSAGASRLIAAQANLRRKLRPQAGRSQSRSSPGTLKTKRPDQVSGRFVLDWLNTSSHFNFPKLRFR
jgi:hypothetical protein